MADEMKQWAHLYADAGFSVFPLAVKGKTPLTSNGFKGATTDKKVIEKWWTKWPDANIGIATGSISGGLVVIDLDVDENKGINGYETLKKWQRENGELPETWTSITGRGGYHFIYRDNAVNKSQAGLYEGVDVRADGGYIVAPPSIHPNGNRYEWETGPGDGEIAIVDDMVARFLLGPEPEQWNGQGFQSQAVIPDGERHSMMIKLVGSLRAKGLDDVAIRAAVAAENEAKCNPPLTERELEKEIFPALSRSWEVAKPYTAVYDNQKIPYLDSFDGFECFEGVDTTQLSTFKISLIPESVRQFAVAVIESIQVEPGMVAPALLGIGSLGVQKKYCVHPHSDWYEPANLYMVIIAEPSERKSPTMKALIEPVYTYENIENEKLAPAIAAYETKKKVLQNKIDYLTKSVTKFDKKGNEKYLDEGDLVTLQQELRELKEVGPMRLVVDDVTMEVLARIMEQNNERAGIFSTEGGIFNMLAGRYSDNPVIDLVLKSYSGDRFVLDRIGRRGQKLDNPLITMLLYVQPVVIKEIMSNEQFNERGLNARILYSIPPSTIGKRGYRVKRISDFDKADYTDVIERLFSIPTPARPIPIELDDDADRISEAFYYEIEEKLKHSHGYWKAWLGKLHGTTMRIALVLHCFEYVEQSEHYKINGSTMTNAVEIGRYFEEHAKAAFDIAGASDPPEVKDAKYILSRIEDMGTNEFKLRDLYQLCKDRKGMEKKEGMIPGLICLIDHGYIRIQKVHAGTQNFQNPQKGGRPSEMVYINPEYINWKERKHE